MHRSFRKNLKQIYVCAVIVCMWILSGCADKKGEELLEVQEISDAGQEKKEENKSEETIYVYVCGHVAAPGVYELKAGSRLYEALEAAGGMIETAADTYLNQAQKVEDGQQIYVPSVEETEQEIIPGASGNLEDGKVNLNTASKEELMTLSGIGEAKAEAILKYREEKGNFQSTEDLKNVEGIKDGVYNKVKEQIKV